MWNPVSIVAKNFRLDPVKLEAFATQHEHKYSIVNDNGYNEVNTWQCDALVRDFKALEMSNFLDLQEPPVSHYDIDEKNELIRSATND